MTWRPQTFCETNQASNTEDRAICVDHSGSDVVIAAKIRAKQPKTKSMNSIVSVFFRNDRAIKAALGDNPSDELRKYVATCVALPPSTYEAQPYYTWMSTKEVPRHSPTGICERVFNQLRVVNNANFLVQDIERGDPRCAEIRPMVVGDVVEVNGEPYRIEHPRVDELSALLKSLATDGSVAPSYCIKLIESTRSLAFRYRLCDTMGAPADSTRAVDAGFVYDAERHGPIEHVQWALRRTPACRCPALVHVLTEDDRKELALHFLSAAGDRIIHLAPTNYNNRYVWPSNGVYAVPLDVYAKEYGVADRLAALRSGSRE